MAHEQQQLPKEWWHEQATSLLRENPGATAEQIGDALGVSKWQVAAFMKTLQPDTQADNSAQKSEFRLADSMRRLFGVKPQQDMRTSAEPSMADLMRERFRRRID